jgi:hypothetical protein
MNSIPSISQDYGLNGGLLQVNAMSMDLRDVMLGEADDFAWAE